MSEPEVFIVRLPNPLGDYFDIGIKLDCPGCSRELFVRLQPQDDTRPVEDHDTTTDQVTEDQGVL